MFVSFFSKKGILGYGLGSNVLYAAGVYSGKATANPDTHRAMIPAFPVTVQNGKSIASVLDTKNAQFMRRIELQDRSVIEQRIFIHRHLPLLVTEIVPIHFSNRSITGLLVVQMDCIFDNKRQQCCSLWIQL